MDILNSRPRENQQSYSFFVALTSSISMKDICICDSLELLDFRRSFSLFCAFGCFEYLRATKSHELSRIPLRNIHFLFVIQFEWIVGVRLHVFIARVRFLSARCIISDSSFSTLFEHVKKPLLGDISCCFMSNGYLLIIVILKSVYFPCIASIRYQSTYPNKIL